MGAFATVEEPGGSHRPASAPAGVLPRTPWARPFRAVARLVRGVTGLDAYERYVHHHSQCHPEEPMESEAQFWRLRWDAEGANPKARCC